MIIFKNKGELDMNAVRVFGVSAKGTDSPIGKFGTGLKYAIAVLLRCGQRVAVCSGALTYHFRLQPMEMRGREFQRVQISRPGFTAPELADADRWEDLPFTTHLGAHWELWMAMRELYSNMLDERGSHERNDTYVPESGQSAVIVAGGAFEALYADRRQYFLENVKVLHRSAEVNVIEGPSQTVFYRGIRVSQWEKPSGYTYDVQQGVTLTEDRTLAFPFQAGAALAKALLQCDKPELLQQVLTRPNSSMENQLTFHAGGAPQPGDAFLEAVERVRAKGEVAALSASADLVYRRVRGGEALAQDVTLEPDEAQLAIIELSYRACELLGLGDARSMPVVVVRSLGQGVLGLASNGKAYVSLAAFEQGLTKVAGTIMEEWLHISCGYIDETREFQNYLIDALAVLAIKQIGNPHKLEREAYEARLPVERVLVDERDVHVNAAIEQQELVLDFEEAPEEHEDVTWPF